MELKISNWALRPAVESAARTAARPRASAQIYAHLRIEAGGDSDPSLTVRGTDGLTMIEARADPTDLTIADGGVVCVAASRLAPLLKELGGDETVELRSHGDILELTTVRDRFEFLTADPDAFPPRPRVESESEWIKLDAQAYASAVASVVLAAAKAETGRYALQGVYIEGVGAPAAVHFFGSDGQRLAHASRPASGPTDGFRALVSPADLALARTAGTHAWLHATTNHLHIRANDTLISATQLQGVYPDVWKTIPSDDRAASVLRVARRELIAALRRVRLLTEGGPEGRTVELEPCPGSPGGDQSSGAQARESAADWTLRLSARSASSGRADVRVPCSFTTERNEERIGFNADHLLDALGAITDDEATIYLRGPQIGAFIRSNDGTYLHLVMPTELE